MRHARTPAVVTNMNCHEVGVLTMPRLASTLLIVTNGDKGVCEL